MGHALRVPVPNVSIIDLVVMVEESIRKEDLHAIFLDTAKEQPTIISTTNKPLVSSDFMGCTHSVIVDLEMTTTAPHVCKIFGWYDNEYGYSSRVCDFLRIVGTL